HKRLIDEPITGEKAEIRKSIEIEKDHLLSNFTTISSNYENGEMHFIIQTPKCVQLRYCYGVDISSK
ncbi:5311_t:CDS:1, partial [Funneliformis caledonium]